MQEEPPIEASWEFTEVRVEKVDDAPLNPSSAADSVASTSSATFSSPHTAINSSQPEVLNFYYTDS